jgi:Domain of unknown function (DUF4214)
MVIAANTMLDTKNAKSYFGATLNNNPAFIKFIYENTLGKTYAEDPDGVNYWVSELANGKSKGEVVTALINAAMDPQYKGLPAQGQFINKVEISNYVANKIAVCPNLNDLSAFANFIAGVTYNSATVMAAKGSVDIFGNVFKITKQLFYENEDLNQACLNEYGSGASLADWNDVKAYIHDAGSSTGFLAETGIGSDYYFLSNNGKRSEPGKGFYLFAYRDNISIETILERIDNSKLYLGAYILSPKKSVLCKCRQ